MGGIVTAREAVANTARLAMKPRPVEKIWEWAERHVHLSVRTTNSPGPYSSTWVAYTRAWMSSFSDPRVREISICAGAQTGKTEALLNCLRFLVVEDPG